MAERCGARNRMTFTKGGTTLYIRSGGQAPGVTASLARPVLWGQTPEAGSVLTPQEGEVLFGTSCLTLRAFFAVARRSRGSALSRQDGHQGWCVWQGDSAAIIAPGMGQRIEGRFVRDLGG
jgi:hypothetical protein